MEAAATKDADIGIGKQKGIILWVLGFHFPRT